MRFGSLFSGIGGMDLGLERAGMSCVWQSEIDKWCNRVLERRFPETIKFGDIRERREYPAVDLIAFGSPCTNISIAGNRKGLQGDESKLFWAAIAILRRTRPEWILFENVNGLRTSHNGRDLEVVLAALAHCGYWWTYRVLDSQYFGVAQRRRRLYIVGHLGAPCPTQILFEPQGGAGALEPRSTTTPIIATTLGDSVGSISNTVATRRRHDAESTYVICDDREFTSKTANGLGVNTDGPMFTIDTVSRHAVGIPRVVPILMGSGAGTARPGGPRLAQEASYLVCSSVDCGGDGEASGVARSMDVSMRCECPDSPRYRAVGNAVTANVAEWIGNRLMAYINMEKA